MVLQPEVMIWRKRKRLQRGCAQVLLKAGFPAGWETGFQETWRNSAGRRHSDPLTRALEWKHVEQGEQKHRANTSKQVCPSYGHHRRAGAQESQGKPGERNQSGQPPLSLQGPWGPGRKRVVWIEPGRRSTGFPGKCLEEVHRWARHVESHVERPLWKSLHSLRGWQIHLGVSKLLRLRENVEDCGSRASMPPISHFPQPNMSARLQDHWSAALDELTITLLPGRPCLKHTPSQHCSHLQPQSDCMSASVLTTTLQTWKGTLIQLALSWEWYIGTQSCHMSPYTHRHTHNVN